MAGALFLSENFWSTQCFPGHVISADEEALYAEAWHVGDGRRSATDTWTPFTPNVAHWNQVLCNRVRGANCCFLDDRPGYLKGVTAQLQASFDGSTWQNAFTVTFPTATVTNNLADTAYGVRTEEGAWGMLFPRLEGLYWRIYVPAMGAGLVPAVVGLYVGMAYQPLNFLNTPWSEDQATLTAQRIVTSFGWQGRGPSGNPRTGQIKLTLMTDDEYDLARYHLGGHYAAGRPTWIVYDIAQADRAVLVARPDGPFGFGYMPQWFPRQAMNFNWLEHEPLAT
jgi:hypothetical protein